MSLKYFLIIITGYVFAAEISKDVPIEEVVMRHEMSQYIKEAKLQEDIKEQTFGLRADRKVNNKIIDAIENGWQERGEIEKIVKSMISENNDRDKLSFDEFYAGKFKMVMYGYCVNCTTPLIEYLLKDIKQLSSHDKVPFVLDAGCGVGLQTRKIAALGAEVVALDFDSSQLSVLKGWISKVDPSLLPKIYLNDTTLLDAEFPENSFDAILCSQVFHYYKGSDIIKILQKFHKWLKPSGRIYLQMFNQGHTMFEWNLPNYLVNMSKGHDRNDWPGEIENSKKSLNFPTTHDLDQEMPKFLHAVRYSSMFNALLRTGFRINFKSTQSLEDGEFGVDQNVFIAQAIKGELSDFWKKIMENKPEQLDELIKGDTDKLTEIGPLGYTPLMTSIIFNLKNIFNYLRSKEIDFETRNEFGENILHIAAECSDEDYLNVLSWNPKSKDQILKFIDSVNKFGDTPLHLAVRNGENYTINSLMRFSADLNCLNKNGFSIAGLAQFTRRYDVVLQLLNYGASLQFKSNDETIEFIDELLKKEKPTE